MFSNADVHHEASPRIRLLAGLVMFCAGALVGGGNTPFGTSSAWAQAAADAPAVAPPAVELPVESQVEAPTTPTKPAEIDLALEQEKIAAKYRRFEEVMLRMAELTAPTDPKRAALLRKAVAQSKERRVNLRMNTLVESLKADRLAVAVTDQQDVQQDLAKLLDLLLSEQRDEQLKSEQQRIKEQIRRIKELILEEQQLQSETERGGETDQLAKRQQQAEEKTRQLSQQMKADEAMKNPGQPGENEETPSPAQDGDKTDKDADPKGTPADAPTDKQPPGDKTDKPADGADKPAVDKPKDGDKPAGEETDPKGKPDDKQKPSDKQPGDPKSGDPQQGKSDDPKTPAGDMPPGGDSQPMDQESQQSPAPPGDSTPMPGGTEQKSPPGESPPPNPTQQKVDNAQQKMKDAREKLEKAEREGAVKDQEAALRELEKAKAELEEILRQLREEEQQRKLAQLEARFRQMLEQQIEVYEGTKRLDTVIADDRNRGTEIEAGRLSRKEAAIVVEAEKTLILLKEDEKAVAFPEAVEQLASDMQQVTTRLAGADVGELTQGIEEDIIALLEEMVAALEKAQQDLEEQKSQPPQPPQQGPEQEPALVDALAELKLIRSLQNQVNRRTERYTRLVQGDEGQAEQPDLLEALGKLSERQDRIFQATRDVVAGKDK